MRPAACNILWEKGIGAPLQQKSGRSKCNNSGHQERQALRMAPPYQMHRRATEDFATCEMAERPYGFKTGAVGAR